MNKDITSLLQQGYTVLTPTMRLSRYLNNRYAVSQIGSGKQAWESADILPWHAWLKRCWDNIKLDDDNVPLILNSSQQQGIWLQVIQDSDHPGKLLHHASVARHAIQAWELIQQWQIPLYPDDLYISHDVRAFQAWANTFEDHCKRRHWLDEGRLASALARELGGGNHRLNLKLALVGHDTLLPQQLALLDALGKAGATVKLMDLEPRNRRTVGCGFIDIHDEINAAANWARKLVQSGTPGSVGLVVPGLAILRSRLQEQFDDVLLGSEILEAVEPETRPYSISLGQGLKNYPLVAGAFSILGLIDRPWSIEDMGVLLRSPFITASESELGKRAMLDANLREHGEPYLLPANLLYIAENHLPAEQQCRVFLGCLEAWDAAVRELPRNQSPRGWAESFSKLLLIFGWPGERTLNSTEYQTMAAWNELMMQFCSLEIVNPSMTFALALSQLRQLATAFSFQPETAELPIQVMGPAGAAGMQFDKLWMLGLHEEAWPQATDPNPFIPLAMQVRHGMPFASAENRLDHSRRLTDRLLQSAADVVVSFPMNDQERPLRPSSLIRPYLKTAAEINIERQASYSKLVFDSGNIEYLEDETAPEISPGQHVSGGAGLFRDQAACPFRAFARYRLQARGLTTTDVGLGPLERGSLLHELMQRFWNKVDGHTALLALSPEQQEGLVDSAVNSALASFQRRRPLTFTTRFTALEKQRLKTVLGEWLALEKQRQPFHVDASEKKYSFNFAGIEVHTRIDRIDRIEDGRLVIVDYKSGNVSIGAWFDERPDDPQLPLYAITCEGEVAGLAFAKMKRGDLRFIGVTNGDDILPAVKSFADTSHAKGLENWEGLLADWQRILLKLGNDFRQGRAEVDPKNQNSCRFCDLHALCRIHEHGEAGAVSTGSGA